MIDLDRWHEVYMTLRKNLLRTFLTAVGVGWGMIMLIITLGAGHGLENGARKQFMDTPLNTAYVWSQTTSMPYKGFRRGRRFELNNDDITALRNEVPEIDLLAPRVQLGGYRGSNNVVRKNKTAAFSVMGDHPEIQQVKGLQVTNGRFINEMDLQQRRKICVLGEEARKALFEPGENPVGDYIKINGLYFQVVGVFEISVDGEQAEREEQTVYIPLATYQKAFNQPNYVSWFAMTTKDDVSPAWLQERVTLLLAKRHSVHPEDPRAFGGFNTEDSMEQANVVFNGIRFLGWFFGGLTLLAGGIGVSNIMLVVVRERTKEIGVRRALGATPGSIRSQVITESIVLTLLAGMVGMLVGTWAIEGLAALVEGAENEFFENPYVNVKVVLGAVGILCVCGLIAGLIPASRAVRIKTIDALRSD